MQRNSGKGDRPARKRRRAGCTVGDYNGTMADRRQATRKEVFCRILVSVAVVEDIPRYRRRSTRRRRCRRRHARRRQGEDARLREKSAAPRRALPSTTTTSAPTRARIVSRQPKRKAVAIAQARKQPVQSIFTPLHGASTTINVCPTSAPFLQPARRRRKSAAATRSGWSPARGAGNPVKLQ